MRAVRDPIRITGSKNQLYFRMRAAIGAPLVAITIDLSNA